MMIEVARGKKRLFFWEIVFKNELMRWINHLIVLGLIFVVTSCGMMKSLNGSGESDNKRSNSGAFAGLPAEAQISRSGGGQALGGAQRLEKQDFSNLVFTDPDNPDKPIPELDQVFEADIVDGWFESYTEAKDAAIKNQRPLILLFTKTEGSPNCAHLEREVWKNEKFKAWADKELVLVKFDLSFGGTLLGEAARKRRYVEGLKKQYKALGVPTVVVLTADGQYVHRETGYVKGRTEFYLDQLKFRVEQAQGEYLATRERYKKRGFRDWRSAKGTTLFAKLLLYRDGKLLLERLDKERVVVEERLLDKENRDWIAEQKNARKQRAAR